MKNTYVLLLIILSLISCSKNDYLNKDNQCKVIGTNGDYKTEYNTVTETIDTIGDIIYPVQYVYNSKNLLITRIRYDNVYSISDFHRDIDNINYDSNNRINEISTYNRVKDYTAVKTYEYNGSSTLPTKITRHKLENNGSKQLTYTESLTHNHAKQLSRVLKTPKDMEYSFETVYSYNEDGNLIELKVEEIDIDNNIIWRSIETYGNYDNQRNPFNGLPFSDLRGISESNNNYFKYSKTAGYTETYLNSGPTPSESSGYTYTPTDLNYLKRSKYQCDE
ncbi:MAG: hypothetical protein ABJH82_08220 [Polaribacter sp.]|uniref:hypothetical protein n=1 Tax=Polaribacter sp. TaxID=1920175 RepID=UPI0032630B4D